MDAWSGPDDDKWDAAQAALADAGLTDGLPVTPPTRQRIEAALKTCGLDPGATIATLPPAYAEITWRDVAMNAVMAGCAPAYLPVVGAAVAAMAAPEFNLLGIATTTGSATVCTIVNGPIARTLGMNGGANALGPGNRANATIGRAIRLVLQNAGGAKPGEIDMATLGQPGKYTLCFAENESESPWPPLHVERGFDRAASAVTVFGVSGTLEIVDSESATPEALAQTFAQSLLVVGNVRSVRALGGAEPLIVMPPEHAEVFARAGCSKADVKALVARGADDVAIVVAGGVGRKAAYLPTWSGATRSVTRAIG